MNFRDKWAKDEEGNEFIFTVEMQRKLSEAGLPVEPESLEDLDEQDGGNGSVQKRQPTQARREEPEEDEIQPETIQIDPATGKYVGRMKWYNPARGYGFIARGGGEDIFFHKTSVMGDPRDFDEGQWMLYDVEETQKGLEANEVEPYEGDLIE